MQNASTEQLFTLIHMRGNLESNNIRRYRDIRTFSNVQFCIYSRKYDVRLPKLLALCRVRSLMKRDPIISQCRMNLEAVSLKDLSWSFNGYNNVSIASITNTKTLTINNVWMLSTRASGFFSLRCCFRKKLLLIYINIHCNQCQLYRPR